MAVALLLRGRPRGHCNLSAELTKADLWASTLKTTHEAVEELKTFLLGGLLLLHFSNPEIDGLHQGRGNIGKSYDKGPTPAFCLFLIKDIEQCSFKHTDYQIGNPFPSVLRTNKVLSLFSNNDKVFFNSLVKGFFFSISWLLTLLPISYRKLHSRPHADNKGRLAGWSGIPVFLVVLLQHVNVYRKINNNS